MTIKFIQPVFSYDFIAMAFPQQKSSTALNHVIITILVLFSSTCVCGKTNTTLICQLNHCNITVLVLVHNIIQTTGLPLSWFLSITLYMYKLLHYHCLPFGPKHYKNYCITTVLVLVNSIIQTTALPLSWFWSIALYKLLHYHCLGFGQ